MTTPTRRRRLQGRQGPAGPWILSIECGDEHLSVALQRLPADAGSAPSAWRLTEEVVSHRGHRHADSVLVLVEQVLARHGVSPSDLSLLACGSGPGSFTGVRVGMATAVGLSMGADVPIWCVSSLESMALHAAGHPAVAVPLIDARKSEVYGAAYRVSAGADVESVLAPRVGACESVLMAARDAAGEDAPLLVFGSGALTYGVASEVPQRWHLGAASHHGVLAGSAWERAGRDGGAAPAVDPSYVRLSDAEISHGL